MQRIFFLGFLLLANLGVVAFSSGQTGDTPNLVPGQVSDAASSPQAVTPSAVEQAAVANPAPITIPTTAPAPAEPPATPAVVLAHDEALLFEEVTITVASQQAEPLTEAPVVTSVVTADEIKRMGARTLNDVLLTLPGFTMVQDHNELYSAERGIYASSQQKILVLRDGHRLNSRSYSEANFDYAISLENVDHIEVMRGPGGSIYGDVALTAVINLVTFAPKDFQGTKLIAGVGNYEQKKAALVSAYDLKEWGKFLISGSTYRNLGQVVNSALWGDPRRPQDAGGSILYGFRKPAFDVYLKYDWQALGVKASERYCDYMEPRSGGGNPSSLIYDVDKYSRENDETPGLSSLFDNYEISYTPVWAGYEWATRVYYDGFKVGVNLVSNNNPATQGQVHWSEWVGGVQSRVSKDYSLSMVGLGKGSAIVGVQTETMEVYESTYAAGVNPSLDRPGNPALSTGKERTYSAFGQAKQWLMDALILNLGVRYDYKVRRTDPRNLITINDVAQVSPRAALIYMPSANFNFRLSYGHCFVDAPYWYRYNNLPGYTGAMTLQPETMNSYQFSAEQKLWEKELSHQINFFYNDFTNVVYRDAAQIYSNAGAVKSNGVEYELAYKRKDLSARVNYTFQQFTEATGLVSRWGNLENVPEHTGNLIVDVAPLAGFMAEPWAQALWLDLGLRYVGRQFSRWGKSLANARDTVDAAWVVNAGITAGGVLPGLELGVHAYNLTDQQYFQGGSVDYPYLQPGRWFMGEVSYKF